MRLLERQLRCEVHQTALGDHNGEVEIEIRPDIQAATLLEDLASVTSCGATACRCAASIR